MDTAHKLALLAAVAFGNAPALDGIHVEGIERITPLDIDATAKLIHEWHAGYVSHYNPRTGNVTCVRDDSRGSFVPPHLVRMVAP